MAANYDFFLTPQPKDKSQEAKYHARVVVKNALHNKHIAKEIAQCSTIRQSEALAVMDEMTDYIRRMLAEGHAVHLEGLGSFRISAKSPSVRSKKEVRAESIRFGGVVFRPEKKLLRSLGNVKFKKVEYSQTSCNISEIEIDDKLMDYFKDHTYITTKQLQMLCGLSNHTALRRLQERVVAGTLTHPGHLRSALYFPVPGNYGVSRVADEADAGYSV